jgi:radical SAM enzyme (TIGR01210 family)
MVGHDIDVLSKEGAWYSINTTTSRLHYRFQIGFRNVGCEYWRNNSKKLGCLNCGYFFETTCGFIDIPNEHLIAQFRNAYNHIKSEVLKGIEPSFDVVEFLSDGSFLNDKEVPEEVRLELFKIINDDENISRILIETRPEYVTKEKILNLLSQLKKGQELEIAMGLESTDRFILTFCINKGYCSKEVEKVVETLQEINAKYENRCSILLYALVKPAYLEEKEALEDAVSTLTDIYKLGKKYKVNVIAKLEPVVIPQGTILDALYHHKQNNLPGYFPPSYWTILEIIARLEYEGMSNIIRIGAREDMDRYFEIPAIYYNKGNKKGMFSRYDFLIYETIQEYNTHHNFRRLLITLERAFEDKSLSEWKEEIGIKYPMFLRYYEEHRKEIEKERQIDRAYFDSKNDSTSKLIEALNSIEYGKDFQTLAQEYQKNKEMRILNKLTKKIKDLLKEKLKIPQEKIRINDKDIAILQDELKLLRMHIKILIDINGHEDDRSIWIGIPTAKLIPLSNMSIGD